MANPAHLEILRQGVAFWNEWRKANPMERMDLSDANLSRAILREINFSAANLKNANLTGADLCNACLNRADLGSANLNGAKLNSSEMIAAFAQKASFVKTHLSKATLLGTNLALADLNLADFNSADMRIANLSGANLNSATMRDVNLADANLSNANLSQTDLGSTNLSGADLTSVNLHWAHLSDTVLTKVDLRTAQGLDDIIHLGPSQIGIDTLYASAGMISEKFLRGCGVPDSFINQIKALIGAEEGFQFYSCFISYSTKDEDFAKRLHGRLQQEHVRVWFAPHDMQGGKKVHEQIDEAIKVYDKLLIILSPDSLHSEWVMTELRKARKAERKTGKRKLFPLGLVDFDTLRDWECFDPDTGQDLAVEVRQYFIPDFINWKDHDDYEEGFARLLKDLRANV